MLGASGDWEGAELSFRRALEIKPDGPMLNYNLGKALQEQGRLEEAVAAFRRGTELKSDQPEIFGSLGIALQLMGKLDEAAVAYRQAIAINAEQPAVHNNLGNVLQAQGNAAEAITCYEKAISVRQRILQHANQLREQGRQAEANTFYQHATQHAPEHRVAINNLAGMLFNQGRVEEAVGLYQHPVADTPDYPDPYSNGLSLMMFVPDITGEELFEEHRRWAQKFAEPLNRAARPHANTPDPGRRLRVGLVSPDLRAHPASCFVLPVLTAHDRERLEMICYSDVRSVDEVTERLRGQADGWRDISRLTDEQVAEQVRADEIDILVDLVGHSAFSRMLVFARRPAPIAVAQFGYPTTTGLSAMDYRITDAYADPPGATEQFYTEQLIRLPETAWVYQPMGESPAVSPLPAASTGQVTFGSLNNVAKLHQQVLAAWAQILLGVPGSGLKIFGCPPEIASRLRSQLRSLGVDEGRVETLDRASRDQYLNQVATIDIALDPFPYNGGVTTCDALWMGVPVVTLAGTQYLSRQGVSVLNNAGLPELMAPSAESYAAIAVGLAKDLGQLSRIREGLRDKLGRSIIMDGPRYVRSLERAYREVWSRWCAVHGGGA